MRNTDKIANRQTIANTFNTDELTTHRICMNTNWGFFVHQFGDDAQKMWDEAHPFTYPEHPSKDYTAFSLDFIAKHFELFSTSQFWTSANWEYNPNINKMEWTYKSGYQTIKNN